MVPLAEAGYYIVAPDQRGYGRTTGWEVGGIGGDASEYDGVNLYEWSTTAFVRDALAVAAAVRPAGDGDSRPVRVRCVVGIDAGAVTATGCAVARPDVFESVALLTHPFSGTSKLPDASVSTQATGTTHKPKLPSVHDGLAALGRKHYKWYYSTKPANADMTHPSTPGGLPAFLRGYYHVKSGSWAGNRPHPLEGGWSAEALAQLPYYYVMPLEATMPEAVAALMTDEFTNRPAPSESDKPAPSSDWLSDTTISVYASEYARTTFQGGLNWYRAMTSPRFKRDMDVFAGLRIRVPTAFIAGGRDWGTFQEPGAIERMKDGTVCSDFRFYKLVEEAGHWIPEEKPEEVVEAIKELVAGL